MTRTATPAEYDPFSPQFQADPFSMYRWMLDEAPVYYSEKWNWWALSRFADVRAAALDPDTFRSFEGIDIDDTAKDQSGPGFLPDVDNPRHDQLRRLVQAHFLPRRIAAQEDGIRAVVRGLIARWQDRGQVDLAQELSWPMPNEVFFNLVGLPSAREAGRDQLEKWVHELKNRRPGDACLTPVAKAATAGIQNYFVELLSERRRNPREDLLTHLVQADIDGTPFAEEHLTATSEILGLMTVLFLGGVETTAGLTSTLFKLLAENPSQRELLKEDPSLIPAAVEETVRHATPLQPAVVVPGARQAGGATRRDHYRGPAEDGARSPEENHGHPHGQRVRSRGPGLRQATGSRGRRHARTAGDRRTSVACLGAGRAHRSVPGRGAHPAVLALR